MNTKTDCTYCDGIAVIVKKQRTLTYRKEQFNVVEHFYKCQKCQKEFTTTEVDALTFVQLTNQYREKFNIPFVEDICEIRAKYELPASKMSEVLGLGANGYSNFEKGEVPSPALGNLITIAQNPLIFLSFVEKTRSSFTNKAYEMLTQRIKRLIVEEQNSKCLSINWFMEPNNYTGYIKPNLNKIIELVSVFISKCKSEFNDKLKLNKLLYYSDFYHYSQVGQSITGLTYRAISYGPAPTYYDNIFSRLIEENNIISKWSKDSNGSGHEFFSIENECDLNLFSQNELNSIDFIIEKFKETSSWEMVELSHEEKAWKELNANHEIISYQKYAFDLKGVSTN